MVQLLCKQTFVTFIIYDFSVFCNISKIFLKDTKFRQYAHTGARFVLYIASNILLLSLYKEHHCALCCIRLHLSTAKFQRIFSFVSLYSNKKQKYPYHPKSLRVR